MSKAKLTKVEVSLPFGLGSAEWEADDVEQRAAWKLYVELVTRVSIEQLPAEEGSLREALSSLHSLFDTTRQVLREAGPQVGIETNSVGGLAIAVLNLGLRPFLNRWHTRLSAWERQHLPAVASEAEWPEAEAFRKALADLQRELRTYAAALAAAAGLSPEIAADRG